MKIKWLPILPFIGMLNATSTSAKINETQKLQVSQYIEQSDHPVQNSVNETLMEGIIIIVADVLGINESSITPSSTFEALGADSISMCEIAIHCEQSYTVEISGTELKSLTNVQSLHDLIHYKIVASPR